MLVWEFGKVRCEGAADGFGVLVGELDFDFGEDISFDVQM